MDDAIRDCKETAKLKLFCDAFHDLVDDFDEEIEYLEAVMQPIIIARGIDHLPDDILADIIEFVEAPSNDLANVCHRFRRVMYYLPNLWSTISTSDNDVKFNRRLERSKGADLLVIVDVNKERDNKCTSHNLFRETL